MQGRVMALGCQGHVPKAEAASFTMSSNHPLHLPSGVRLGEVFDLPLARRR
jgi:hypothetical protein